MACGPWLVPIARNAASSVCKYIAQSIFSALSNMLSYSDEFAEVKNVKILRRGRRILEAEKEFGKILTNDPFASCKSCSESKTVTSSIPPLTVDFFASKFYQRFIMQRTWAVALIN